MRPVEDVTYGLAWVPLAMVLSGGYGPLSWEAHARSLEAILSRFDQRG